MSEFEKFTYIELLMQLKTELKQTEMNSPACFTIVSRNQAYLKLKFDPSPTPACYTILFSSNIEGDFCKPYKHSQRDQYFQKYDQHPIYSGAILNSDSSYWSIGCKVGQTERACRYVNA